jgi:hypothetical protein
MTASLAGLFAALIAAPDLPDAACRGRHETFDPPAEGEPKAAVEARHRRAQAVCADCPALTACATWIASLPPKKRPRGVVAGRVLAVPPGRPARPAATTGAA